jgi:hypothetical protein
MNEPDQKPEWARSLGLFTVIVSELLGLTGAGVAAGYLGWKKLGLPGWFAPLMALAGFGLAIMQVYRVSKKEWNG